MKVAIVFYSFTGNTKRLCGCLRRQLDSGKKIPSDFIELKTKDEPTAFLRQCADAFLKKTPELAPVNFRMEAYDFIVFATPVWALTITPALRSFLSAAGGLENKKVACLVTCHSGAGVKKTLKEMEDILREKGARTLFSQAIKGWQTESDKDLEEKIGPLIEIISS